MQIHDLIAKKRDGKELSESETGFFIESLTKDTCSDTETSEMLTAIGSKGMNDAETMAFTKAMLHSENILDTSQIPGLKIDKLSTGGVGDKTSIILAPLLSAMGVKVPMIASRALGHSGGTLDKIESIAGFKTSFDTGEMLALLKDQGGFIAGQSGNMTPADRILHTLRDSTVTEGSIPLIASSLMSKKLAEGLDALVLDVKFGRGPLAQHGDE